MLDTSHQPFDPDIFEWCSNQRINHLKQHFGDSTGTLLRSNLLLPAVRAWIKEQILQSYLDPSSLQKILEDPKISDQSLISWSRKLWSHRLESIYLSQKSLLDTYSCLLLRVTDRHLSFELFNRLRADEAPFEQLSFMYGEGPERSSGGLLKNKRLQDLPPALHKLIRKLKPGEILKPHKVGNWYIIISILEWTPAQFDERLRRCF